MSANHHFAVPRPAVRLLKTFVAGPSSQLSRCEDVILKVRRFAMVTADWAAVMRANLDVGISDTDLGPAECLMAAAANERGIDEADVVLWLSGPSMGAAWEAGYAWATGKELIAVGPVHPIYSARCSQVFATDADALAYLSDRAIRVMRGGL